MLLLAKPSVTDVRDARQGLGLTPELAAEVLGLPSWNAEKGGGRSTLDPCKWSLFQLMTGLHKTLFLFDRSLGDRHVINLKDPAHRALLKTQLERPKGSVLREARFKVGLTQTEMARLAGMGQVSWARLESGSPVKRYTGGSLSAGGHAIEGPPTYMDAYRWEILKLILGVHDKWELRRQDFPNQTIPLSYFFTNEVQNERTLHTSTHDDGGGCGSHRRLVPDLGHADLQPGDNGQHLSNDLQRSVLIEPTPEMQREAMGLILEAIKEVGLKVADVVAMLKAGPSTVAQNLTAAQAQAVHDIRDTLDDNGLEPERLLKCRALPKPDKDGRVGAYAMVYQDPTDAGQQWSGKGRPPHWVKLLKRALEKEGKDPNNFEVYRIRGGRSSLQ